MTVNPEVRRAGSAYATQASSTLLALEAAEQRAEALLARLEAGCAQAEQRLVRATELAQQTLAVAEELRNDVTSLIDALQGLATEVDAQMKEHTRNLMAGLASAKAASPEAPDVPVRQRAAAVASELSRKAEDLRLLIEEAGLAQASVEAPLDEPSYRPVSEPIPVLSEKVRAVEDEVSIGRAGSAGERYSRAVEMARQGLSADEIARSCGLGREEVRMLLRLRSLPTG